MINAVTLLFLEYTLSWDQISVPNSIQQHGFFLPFSSNGWTALDVFLKLNSIKYKYNVYSITSAGVLSCSNILI